MLRGLLGRRSRLQVGLVAGLVVVAVAVAVDVTRRDTGPHAYTGDDGPIRALDGRIWEGLAIDTPLTQTWGGLSLPNRTDYPIELGEFRISPPLGGGFRLLGSKVATDPDREYAEAGPFPGYPSPDLGLGPLSAPVEGTVIPPHSERGVVLVLGLEVSKPGVYWWDRIEVDFRYKGRRYTMQNELGLYFCAPISTFPDGCKALFDDHPREICHRLGYKPWGDNGCVPPEAS